MPANTLPRTILGIDPGVADMGYGIISTRDGSLVALTYGSIATPKADPTPQRLVTLEQELEQLITTYTPDCVAIEKLFFNRNVTTALRVGEARGVALLVCGRHQLPVCELTPSQVKQTVSGYGGADKRQVQNMVKIILKLEAIPQPDDAADALAIALSVNYTSFV